MNQMIFVTVLTMATLDSMIWICHNFDIHIAEGFIYHKIQMHIMLCLSILCVVFVYIREPLYYTTGRLRHRY